MIELQAGSFVGAVTEMRALIVLIGQISDKAAAAGDHDKINIIGPHLSRLIDALIRVGARSALASANRLNERITASGAIITYSELGIALFDIESRFADHLADIKLFVLNEQEASLLDSADQLLGFAGQSVSGFSAAFPNAALEIEEGAKCIALGRYTASVFHCMRALEVAIKSFSKLLKIPDPTKPAEKNWGAILRAIKAKIDEKWPQQTRLANTDGAHMESLFVTLDAVKNPWRNATMHVEATYYPHEALHIIRCTGMFLLELMKHCDEEGRTGKEAPALVTVSDSTVSSATGVSTAG